MKKKCPIAVVVVSWRVMAHQSDRFEKIMSFKELSYTKSFKAVPSTKLNKTRFCNATFVA